LRVIKGGGGKTSFNPSGTKGGVQRDGNAPVRKGLKIPGVLEGCKNRNTSKGESLEKL